MNIGFINSLTGDFITHRDFLPLKDENGNIVAGGAVGVLTKQSFGSLVILELIDADRLPPEGIRRLLENNPGRLEAINVPQCFVFEVFIFSGSPGEETLKIIDEGQYHRTMARKHVKCLTVDLGAGTLQKHYKVPANDFGISAAIAARLGGKAGDAPADVPIEEVVRKREEERKISYRAKTPFLTYALIAVNILVAGLIYLYSMRSGQSYSDLLTVFGAKVNSSIMNGEYWRLITPVFLHSGTVHLLINCYSLYVIGITVERVFGHLKFALIYFFAGLMGCIFSFMFSINPGVGASGAIFGLMGALLFFGLERPALFRAYFGYSVIATIVVNLAYGFSRSGIDNYAHLGGLVGGFFATGAVNAAAARKWYLNRFLYLLLALAIAGGGLYYGFTNGNNLSLGGRLGEIQGYIDSSNFSEAERIAEDTLRARPLDREVKASLLRGALIAEAMAGKPEEALQHARELTEVNPGDGHYFSAMVYYDMKRYEDAKAELLKAKELKARFTDIDEMLKDLEALTAG